MTADVEHLRGDARLVKGLFSRHTDANWPQPPVSCCSAKFVLHRGRYIPRLCIAG
jgi:hypothetical protein